MRGFVFPAISDKNKYPVLIAPSIEYDGSEIAINPVLGPVRGSEGDYSIEFRYKNRSGSIGTIITSHIFGSQLRRIIAVKRSGVVNRKNFSVAGNYFLNIAEFNMFNNAEGKTIHEVIDELVSDSNKTEEEVYNEVYKMFELDAQQAILDSIANDFNNLYKYKSIQNTIKNNMGGDIDEFSIYGQLVKFLINEYIVSTTIHNNFIGDSAMFAKVKNAIGEDGKIDFYKLVQIANDEMFKRWGGAVGTTIKGELNNKYTQIILQDEIGTSDNIDYLAKLYYPDMPKKDLNAITKLKDNYDSDVADKMKDKYPEIADHLEITKSDAQEYVTWREALNVMYSMGVISKEDGTTMSAIIKKLDAGEKLSPEEHKFFIDRFDTAINATKPLGTSRQIMLDDNGRPIHNAFNYIKSSAVVLLPQFTKGWKLDKLRVTMEELEKKTGNTVRAAYVSAMKADTPLTPMSLDDISVENAEKSSHTTDRGDWGIQQSFPNHFQHDVALGHRSTIVLSTQLRSMMFDLGTKVPGPIAGLELHQDIVDEYNKEFGTDLKADKITSEEVERVYSFIFNKLLQARLAEFNSRLGEDMSGIKDIVIDVLKSNGAPQPVIDFIKNTDKLFNTGDIRIDTIIYNAIKNNVTNIRVRGVALVAMSSSMLELDGTRGDSNRIVFTREPGGLRDAGLNEDGSYRPAEVFLPSTFLDKDGNIIDLTDEKYSYRDENGFLRLREGVVAEELLDGSGVRLPYSNLNSGSGFVIAGFLPPEMGNTVVLPPSIVAQKCIGHDGDKDNIYLYNSTTDDKGNIVVDDEGLHKYENALLRITNAMYRMKDNAKNFLMPLSSRRVKPTIDAIKSKQQGVEPYMSPVKQVGNYNSGRVGKQGVRMFSMFNVAMAILRRANRIKKIRFVTKHGDVIEIKEDKDFNDSGLSTSNYISVLQNESVDNAKNNNLGYINCNASTFTIYAGFALTLDDINEDGWNLPILFMSSKEGMEVKKMIDKSYGKDLIQTYILNIHYDIFNAEFRQHPALFYEFSDEELSKAGLLRDNLDRYSIEYLASKYYELLRNRYEGKKPYTAEQIRQYAINDVSDENYQDIHNIGHYIRYQIFKSYYAYQAFDKISKGLRKTHSNVSSLEEMADRLDSVAEAIDNGIGHLYGIKKGFKPSGDKYLDATNAIGTSTPTTVEAHIFKVSIQLINELYKKYGATSINVLRTALSTTKNTLLSNNVSNMTEVDNALQKIKHFVYNNKTLQSTYDKVFGSLEKSSGKGLVDWLLDTSNAGHEFFKNNMLVSLLLQNTNTRSGTMSIPLTFTNDEETLRYMQQQFMDMVKDNKTIIGTIKDPGTGIVTNITPRALAVLIAFYANFNNSGVLTNLNKIIPIEFYQLMYGKDRFSVSNDSLNRYTMENFKDNHFKPLHYYDSNVNYYREDPHQLGLTDESSKAEWDKYYNQLSSVEGSITSVLPMEVWYQVKDVISKSNFAYTIIKYFERYINTKGESGNNTITFKKVDGDSKYNIHNIIKNAIDTGYMYIKYNEVNESAFRSKIKTILLMHIGDGKFILTNQYWDTNRLYVNPFYTEKGYIQEEETPSLPLKDYKEEPSPFKLTQLKNITLKIAKAKGLTDEQTKELQRTLDDVKVKIIDRNGNVIYQLGVGKYELNMFADSYDQFMDRFDSEEHNVSKDLYLRDLLNLQNTISEHTDNNTKYTNEILKNSNKEPELSNEIDIEPEVNNITNDVPVLQQNDMFDESVTKEELEELLLQLESDTNLGNHVPGAIGTVVNNEEVDKDNIPPNRCS